MNITMPDGSEAEVSVDEYAQLAKLGLVYVPPPVTQLTQADRLREAFQAQAELHGLVAPEVEPVPPVKAPVTGLEIPETAVLTPAPTPAVMPQQRPRLPGEPRRGVSRHIAVTEAGKIVLEVMRSKGDDYEWTSVEVAKESKTTGDMYVSVKNTVSEMKRDHRGLILGRNNTYYRLDEFGRHGIITVFKRPTYPWPGMLQAWQEQREWVDTRPPADAE